MRIGIWLKIVTEVVFHFILYVPAIIKQLVRNVHLAALKERDYYRILLSFFDGSFIRN